MLIKILISHNTYRLNSLIFLMLLRWVAILYTILSYGEKEASIPEDEPKPHRRLKNFLSAAPVLPSDATPCVRPPHWPYSQTPCLCFIFPTTGANPLFFHNSWPLPPCARNHSSNPTLSRQLHNHNLFIHHDINVGCKWIYLSCENFHVC